MLNLLGLLLVLFIVLGIFGKVTGPAAPYTPDDDD